MVKLVRCVGSFNTINDFCNEVSISNKTEDLNLSVSNMITGMNESKTLTKHISCECKCKFHGTKCDPNQWWNNDKCQLSVKNIIYVKQIMSGILVHVFVKNKNI